MKKYLSTFIESAICEGIRDLDLALVMIKAGDTRIGTSNGMEIVEEFKARFGK